MSEYTIHFDPTRCIACYGCNTACKVWREVPIGADWCRIEKKWRGRDLEARPVYSAVYCQQCVDAPCVQTCPADALSKNAQTGLVNFDREKCIVCKKCFDACPFSVPQFSEGTKMQKCDMCSASVDLGAEEPPCVATCPSKALVLKRDAVTADKQQQEAALAAFVKMPLYE
jgi:Fe-S-cluster-containing dehydrogenase component